MKYTRSVSLLAVSALLAASLAGCGSSASSVASSASSEAVSSVAESAVSEAASESAAASSALEDGAYMAEFDTDSSMFHVNEADNGKGTLTVKDGQMTIHVSLASKKIVNLFVGKAEDAKKDGADLLQPTVEKAPGLNGKEEDVNAFDIPVPALDEEFDVALIGTKGVWYDHKVNVTNAVKAE